jgi:hypothetical protein
MASGTIRKAFRSPDFAYVLLVERAPVAATVHEVQRRGLSKVEPKQPIILTSTRSRHPNAGMATAY